MINFKKLISLGLVLSCTLAFAGCGSDSSTTYEPLPEEDSTIYSIRICQDNADSTSEAVTQGFTDALIDLFGQSHIQLEVRTAGSELTAADICDSYVQQGAQLILANGSRSLSAAAATTSEIPIVGTNVMDYQQTLHIITSQDSEWDRTTGTNITGVSSLMSISDQLSMLIETTDNLRSVGILYSPEDSNAVYQNELLEIYLDQAGIPWKEYAIPSSPSVSGQGEGTTVLEDSLNIITPSRQAAASAKEGPNTNVESFGESNLLYGINSPAIARTAKTSSTWTADLTPADLAPLSENAGTEEIVRYASAECSALYISGDSLLSDQMELIGSVATAAGVVTVAGDSQSGQHTLVSMYADPYAQGYEAGKMAYRILVNGENPGEIRINQQGTRDNIKLYNNEIASTLGLTFPKSFQEIHTFLETYQIGSNTERIDHSTE